MSLKGENRTQSSPMDRKPRRPSRVEILATIYRQTTAYDRVLVRSYNRMFQAQIQPIIKAYTPPKFYSYKLSQNQIENILSKTSADFEQTLAKDYRSIASQGSDDVVNLYTLPQSVSPAHQRALNTLMAKRAGITIAGLNESTAKQIRTFIASSPPDITAFTEKITSILGSPFRARRIARSETISILNRSAEAGYESNSEVVKAKQWLITEDDRTCQWCPVVAERHNGQLDLGGNYFKQGDSLTGNRGGVLTMIEDIPSPVLHPNCRCAISPVL